MQAPGSAGIEVGAVVAFLECELRAGEELRRELEARAALQDALRRAHKERAAVVAHDGDRLELIPGSAVVFRAQPNPRAEKRAERVLREERRGKKQQQQGEGAHEEPTIASRSSPSRA